MHGLLPLPGDLVWIRRRRWRVERASRDRHIIRLDVAARDRRLTFLSPFDRVVARARVAAPRRVRPQQALALLARLIAGAGDVRVPSAAVHAAVDILPHQLEPAMAMIAGRPRVLIADEVGLGKTIQAGLVIAELTRRRADLRVLVLVPAALRDQWVAELAHRFGIRCLGADRAGVDAMVRAGAFGDNPWRHTGVWIGSPDFLKQRHVADSLPPDPWDLVVIDEAHAVCGDSDRYALCHRIASRSRRTLLLTATPHGGDDIRFMRLIDLGRVDPDRSDLGRCDPDRRERSGQGLAVFRRTRASLGPRPARRVRWHRVRLSESEQRVLDGLRAFERAVTTRSREADQALLLLSVLRKRALSTMSALSLSLTRRLAWLGEPGPESALDWAQPRLDFEGEADSPDAEEREGLTAQSGLGNQQERSWLRRLRALADEASSAESKVERVVSLIQRSAEPVVVFTEFRDSLLVIVRRLRFGRPVAVLHGGQDANVRRQNLRQFLDGTATVLVATDVASQGLNLQARARWVISVELPWNPTRLEQRIGRVDRISQTRPTHLTLLVARDEAESGLLLHLSRRVFAARRAFSDDALASVAPAERDVRAALLRSAAHACDTPAESADSPARIPLALCRRWTRPALLAAPALRRARALAARWRAPDRAAVGAVRSDRGRALALVPHGHRRVFVFSVPILDAAGIPLERRIVAVAIKSRGGAAASDSSVADALRSAVAAAVTRRVRVAARFVAGVERAALARDLAITRILQTEIQLDELQPGLFDRNDARELEARAADYARVFAGADRLRHSGAGRQSDPVRAGDPVLELVLERQC